MAKHTTSRQGKSHPILSQLLQTKYLQQYSELSSFLQDLSSTVLAKGTFGSWRLHIFGLQPKIMT